MTRRGGFDALALSAALSFSLSVLLLQEGFDAWSSLLRGGKSVAEGVVNSRSTMPAFIVGLSHFHVLVNFVSVRDMMRALGRAKHRSV